MYYNVFNDVEAASVPAAAPWVLKLESMRW